MSAEDFSQKVTDIVLKGFAAVGISMGTRLGLFDGLAKLSRSQETAVTTSQLAQSLNYKERYVREWINGMVCADIVDHVEVTGEDRYWIAPYRASTLTKSSGSWSAQSAEMLLGGADQCRSVERCFPVEGPSGTDVDDYPGLHEFLARRKSVFKQMTDVEKMLNNAELVRMLDQGIDVLEIGAGAAHPTEALAARFPKSRFVASELTEDNLVRAKENCKDLSNVTYAILDACNVPDSMRGKFDFIMLFDVFHDVPYPQKLLEGAVQLLRYDGRFLMTEIDMMDTVNKNKSKCADSGVVMYTISTLYCLPTSVRHPGGAGLGACAGAKVYKSMLEESGLVDVETRRDDYLGLSFLASKKRAAETEEVEPKKMKS